MEGDEKERTYISIQNLIRFDHIWMDTIGIKVGGDERFFANSHHICFLLCLVVLVGVVMMWMIIKAMKEMDRTMRGSNTQE